MYYEEFIYDLTSKGKIFKRDNYKCVQCGFDRNEFFAKIRRLDWRKRDQYVKSQGFNPGYAYLEIDHIIPIKMGGDPIAASNQQTLCYRCHKEKTKGDVGNIARMNAICREIREYWRLKEEQEKMEKYWRIIFAQTG